jgi:hypothetical protein
VNTCQSCGATLPPRPPGKRGPRCKYCAACAKASTAESKRRHKKVERETELTEREKAIMQIPRACCRRYARESSRHGFTCPKHRPISIDAGVVTSDETRVKLGELLGDTDPGERGFRVATRPSAYLPRQTLTFPNDTKCGRDPTLEDFAKVWLRSHRVREIHSPRARALRV